MLVGVEGYSWRSTLPGGVRRHIGEVHAGVLRAHDVAAIRAVNIGTNVIDLSVLRRATDINDVWEARGRPDRHVIAALPGAVIERTKTRCAVSPAGALRPAAIGAGRWWVRVKQSPCRHVCVID